MPKERGENRVRGRGAVVPNSEGSENRSAGGSLAPKGR